MSKHSVLQQTSHYMDTSLSGGCITADQLSTRCPRVHFHYQSNPAGTSSHYSVKVDDTAVIHTAHTTTVSVDDTAVIHTAHTTTVSVDDTAVIHTAHTTTVSVDDTAVIHTAHTSLQHSVSG
ncbi:hypothetical protein ACOMHN_031998 [Nucella lapillus]